MRALFIFLAGCGVKLGDPTSGGTSGGAPKMGDASVSNQGTDAGSDAITGVSCGRDPATHVELCSGISICPGILVDPDAFPGCGFAPNAMVLLCLCVDQLCTMGKPKSCAEVKTILASANVLQVCSQVSEGTCAPAK